jgi:hypothetical protein
VMAQYSKLFFLNYFIKAYFPPRLISREAASENKAFPYILRPQSFQKPIKTKTSFQKPKNAD